MKRTLLVLITWFAAVQSLRSAETVNYLRDVKPILKAHCYECHRGRGAESDLRLDTARAAIEGGNTGAAVVPGDGGKSLLIARVTAAGDERMPPPDEGQPLSAEQIAIIRAWIDSGARAPADERPSVADEQIDHWAFQPVARPAIPQVNDASWPRTALDYFVLAKLEAAGIRPSPEADRAALIRRLSLDLIGLPPTLAELDEFLSDKSDDAYQRLVDRLLASKHYGERWGRLWLDQARYADSDGYTNDVPRSIWMYRDWVIRALNRDMPFDEFTIDQLAGDLRPDATRDQKIATGFHRNTQHNREGGSDPEQYRVERVVDRVSTTGEVFMGLSVGCARCHDHKFDPLSQREFYQLYAFFDSCDEPTFSTAAPEQTKRLGELAGQIKAATSELAASDQQRAARQLAWEKSLAQTKPVEWRVLEPVEAVSKHGATIEKQADGSLFVSGKIPYGDTYTVRAPAPLANITAVRLEALTDDRLPSRGPGLTPHGNFLLYEFTLSQRPGQSSAKPAAVAFSRAWADHSQSKFHVSKAIDGNDRTGWAINVTAGQGKLNVDRTAIFTLEDELASPPGTELTFRFEQYHPGDHSYQIGKFRLSVTAAPAEHTDTSIDPELRKLAAIEPGKRTAVQKKRLADAFAKHDQVRTRLASRLEALKKQQQQIKNSIPTTLVIRQRAKPRETYVHLRGDFLARGRTVSPGFPRALAGPKAPESPTRMDLARWLADRRHPLTARVTVNRVWQAYFGRGIVETDNDFGTQGSPPTHPLLLDFLADQFAESGWSFKALHRLIVNSAVYRQSSRTNTELTRTDPHNRLLARQSRHRLDAELIRDAALRTAGLLSPKMFGPGVYPPQPAGVMRLARNPNRKWTVSPGEDRYRRGIYTYFWRGTPYPFLKAFDAPDSNSTCTRRNRSNTPLQALMLLNDEAFFEAAQGLAARTLSEGPDDDTGRIRYAFQLTLARNPSPTEAATLIELLNAERRDSQGKASPWKTPALAMMPSSVSPIEVAAWTSVGRALLNLDEFMTRE